MDIRLATAIFLGILGSMAGSFLNVCIYRLPQGGSLVVPRSRCPRCGTPIHWYDNIPLVSFIILRGKCRTCGGPISLQYPLVEAAGAGLMVIVYFKVGLSFDLLEDATLLFILLGIAVTDTRTYTIPDGLSLSGIVLGLLLCFLPGGITPLESVVGLLVGGGSLYLVALVGEFIFNKEAMGGGDVKMLAMIGAFLGWPGVLFTLFVGSLIGSFIFGWINFVLRKKKLVPFGLFLAIGAGIYTFAGPELIAWYLWLF
jgi:leader peptidase (prepilin peptidase)/N-methyltransferase